MKESNPDTAQFPLRILIVENHPDTIKWLQIFLEEAGYTVGAANNLADGSLELATGRWNVLISDIGLPDGSGWELLEKKKFTAPLYPIAMSGFGMNADSARSHAAGYRHHMLKPFKIAELQKILAEASRELSGAK